MKDLFNNVQVRPSLTNALRSATATGSAVDRAYNGSMFNSAMVVVHTGTITDGTHTITVEESDDNSTWATATALQGTAPAVAAADDDKVFEIGYLGGKRYLRAKSTVSGSPSTGGVYDALVLLGDPRTAPVVRP